ncbi:apolipoprotein N-acyltransferase [Actinomyces sp. 2119]|nr:apolipoprotein N-acyltransferase [Actinomyces sp. 2119]
MALTQGRGAWAGSGLGLAYGVGFFTPLLHFTAVAMGNPVGWSALVAFEALYLALLGSAWATVSRLPLLEESGAVSGGTDSPAWARQVPLPAARGVLRVVVFALLWAGTEELRSSWPLGGFPFGRLAFAMADAPLLPTAAYGGSLGLSFLVAAAGACGAEALSGLRRARLLPVLAGSAGAAVLVLAPGTAAAWASSALQAQDEGSVRIGAVQGNVAEDFEDAFARALEVTSNHAEATHQLAADAGAGTLDLVVWPENAADLDPRSHAASAAVVDDAARAVGTPLLLGAVPYEDGVRYNDVLVWTAGEGAGDYYRKHRPVPFGEYVPARDLVRQVTTQVDRVSVDLLPGTGPHTLTVPAAAQDREVTLAVGICFEVAYDDTLRSGVLQGGQAIIIPTNNASFLHSGEAAQQLAQGRVQAVIHGRSLVQVSTVGHTAVISPDGVVQQAVEPYTQASLVADVGLRGSVTVADRLGDWPGRGVLGLSAILVLAGMVGAARHRVAAPRPGS